MVSCKTNYASLIEIEGTPTHTLESFAAYWQHFDIAWPQQKPTKGTNSPKISQHTTYRSHGGKIANNLG